MKDFPYTESKDTRSGFGAGLHELGKTNPNVVALCADLTGSLKMDAFKKDFPERFFQVGIAEANMMGVACGAAQAKKLNGDDRRVFVLMGDGELEEGQNWEALMYAAHHKIDNLIGIIDRNGQQIDGSTAEIGGLGDLRAKFEAFGWHVLEANGNGFDTLLSALEEAQAATGQGKPVMFIMDTQMGYGVDFMMEGHKWHGVAPNDAQLATALEQLTVGTVADY